ncbi:beta-ketoacyl synthase chain length factor [candidate division CSSED10-310 bacterium]|uniref:Beta-ketoacyl synthase chain length factor n=1 Tax=candidate division CSSED10-310 bacterium TaxID=2855610 RepID=A0ABV6Z463_UNCC1
MSWYILGTGSCSALNNADFQAGRIQSIPALEKLPRAVRRKMGRLAKIMHAAMIVAANRFPLPPEFPLVVGTAYGEIDMGLGVLQDIFETQGRLLRPIKVQNSVHVSAAGQLGIQFKNQGPTLTVSHGKLTAEASLEALLTLLDANSYPLGVAVVGDLFDPNWAQQLNEQADHHRSLLTSTPYYEGAAAIIIGEKSLLPPDWRPWRISGGAYRFVEKSEALKGWWHAVLETLPQKTQLYTRLHAPWDDAFPAPQPGKVDPKQKMNKINAGYGTSMTGPLDHMLSVLPDTAEETLLFLAREDSEIGFIRCDRE